MIYRVMVKKTNSEHPSYTFWNMTVLYCGTSLEDARIEFLKSKANDQRYGYGNRASETVIEQFESEPDEIGSDEAAEVEVDTE